MLKSWLSRINRSRALPGITCPVTSCFCTLGHLPSCAALAAAVPANRATPATSTAAGRARETLRARDDTTDRSMGPLRLQKRLVETKRPPVDGFALRDPVAPPALPVLASVAAVPGELDS